MTGFAPHQQRSAWINTVSLHMCKGNFPQVQSDFNQLKWMLWSILLRGGGNSKGIPITFLSVLHNKPPGAFGICKSLQNSRKMVWVTDDKEVSRWVMHLPNMLLISVFLYCSKWLLQEIFPQVSSRVFRMPPATWNISVNWTSIPKHHLCVSQELYALSVSVSSQKIAVLWHQHCALGYG